MTFEFQCPYCDKILKTSKDKAGRQAHCPGCGRLINVPADVPESSQGSIVNDRAEAEPALAPPASIAGDDFRCSSCGDPLREGTRRCRRCGAIFESSSRHRETRPFPAGEVITESFHLFAGHSVVLVCAFCVATMLPFVIGVFGVGLIELGTEAAGRNGAGELPMSVIMFSSGWIVVIAMLLYSLILQSGFCILTLKVVRQQHATFSDLLAGRRYWGRYAISLLLYLVIVLAGLMVFVVPGLILAAMFLPFAYILIDDGPSGTECLIQAKKLTAGNLGSLLLILIVGACCGIAGTLCCFVGNLIAIPFIHVMIALSYERMTYQTPLSR